MQKPDLQTRLPRIETIDIARGLSLVAMAIYHFSWDLEYFGYVAPGMTETGGWKLFARAIASSFLILVGISLYLANGRGIRWRPFWRRLAMVVAGALAITVVTWFMMREEFIYFGILHEIALASLIGLLFLRLPALVTLLAAIAIIVLPNVYSSDLFDNPAGWVLGLSPDIPRSNDYVPLFPWFGPVLFGLAAVKFAATSGMLGWLSGIRPGRWAVPLRFAGRHSLAFYLLHQPILFGSVWAFAQVFPAPRETPQVRFLQACQVECEKTRDTDFCLSYCSCMLHGIEGEHKLNDLFGRRETPAIRQMLTGLARQCTEETDNRTFLREDAPDKDKPDGKNPGG
ncbi:MAG: DUF1624 domain-containing protein [Rhizobiaceae bacterium]|nr:MAG: DUF1624 domain-containing protein [Rhizobiaceae bacterium]